MWGSAVTEGRACKPGDGGCRVRAGCESLAAGNFAMRSLPAQTVKEHAGPCRDPVGTVRDRVGTVVVALQIIVETVRST